MFAITSVERKPMSGPHEVCSRVYRIGGTEISHPLDCDIYLLDFGDLVVIDSGAGLSFDRLVENISDLGFKPERVRTVIATHGHIDHIGSLYLFQDTYKSTIIAHELDAPAIELGTNNAADMYAIDYIPCVIDKKVKGDWETIQQGKYALNLIHIPGHTPGSLAIYGDIEGNRVLFGQDIHGPYFKKWGADPAQAKKSLQILLSLKADVLCEGHFGIFQPGEAVAEYISGYIDSL
jgi:glyoxylase-like metal-dependent hydrolase (beta-lactamase superfamily II)